MSVLGLDIGTTGVKACAFDAQGRLLGKAYEEYPLQFPQPGWIELDAHKVLAAMRRVVAQAAGQAREEGSPVQAIATSAQGEAVTPLNVNFQPLGPSVVTFDPRTAEFVPFWEEKLGRSAFFNETGMPLHGMYTLPKIQWWKKARSEVFKQAKYFLCYEDFACAALFGLPPVIGTSLAGRTGAYSLKDRAWSKKLLDIAGIDPELLAKPQSAGTIVGEIPTTVCTALNLDKGVKLVVGGHDQALCALGCGIDAPGRASYVTGTVECMAPSFDAPRLDAAMEARNFCCYESALPGKYMSIVFNFTGGSLLKWCRDTLFPEWAAQAQKDGKDPYDVFLSGLPEAPTKIFALPHFTTTGTPHMDTNTSGAFVGLKLDTSRAEILKGVLEGITYEMALNAMLQRESGIDVKEYRAIGGGAKSAAWMRIKADILGVPIACMENGEAGCLGGAMLGLTALKEFASLSEACATLAKVQQRYEPDAKRHAAYQERLEIYAQLYPALKKITHGLGALS